MVASLWHAGVLHRTSMGMDGVHLATVDDRQVIQPLSSFETPRPLAHQSFPSRRAESSPGSESKP